MREVQSLAEFFELLQFEWSNLADVHLGNHGYISDIEGYGGSLYLTDESGDNVWAEISFQSNVKHKTLLAEVHVPSPSNYRCVQARILIQSAFGRFPCRVLQFGEPFYWHGLQLEPCWTAAIEFARKQFGWELRVGGGDRQRSFARFDAPQYKVSLQLPWGYVQDSIYPFQQTKITLTEELLATSASPGIVEEGTRELDKAIRDLKEFKRRFGYPE